MLKFLWALVPSVGALFLFWVALRAVFQADRRERAAIARWEAEHGAAAPVEPVEVGAAPAAGRTAESTAGGAAHPAPATGEGGGPATVTGESGNPGAPAEG